MKKVCLLTGAGGRLGTIFCRLYAQEYDIVAVYRRRPPDVSSQLQRFVEPLDWGATLPENEHPVYVVQADLCEDRNLSYVVDIALARFNRIDLLINSAADLSFQGSVMDCSRNTKKMMDQLNLNALVPLKLAATVVDRFWKNDGGNREANRSIVNVSSTSGLKIFPLVGQSIYSASKAALNALTGHMAHEFETFGVRVNGLAPTRFPGIVSTEAVARAAGRLAEGDMNGEVLVVDKDGEHFVSPAK